LDSFKARQKRPGSSDPGQSLLNFIEVGVKPLPSGMGIQADDLAFALALALWYSNRCIVLNVATGHEGTINACGQDVSLAIASNLG
jgi:hypothetical protein